MTFLLRKAETAQEKREREKRELREEMETQGAEDASREMYKRYQSLFKDLNFAERALEPLTELSEDIEIIPDEKTATGFSFENISAYNKIISKKQSTTAYNILALSLSEDFNPLSQYQFTEENEDGDVVLKPQVPPAPKKTTQERGELEEREFDPERDTMGSLTTDENFSIFSEGDSAPKNVRSYKIKDKKRKIKLNPEINITKLLEDYKRLASKTYEVEDKSGNPMTFEKAFLYLHFNRHKTIPQNAKNPKVRGADISRARKLALRRKRESLKEKEDDFDRAFGQSDKGSKSRDEKDMAKVTALVLEQKETNDAILDSINLTLEALNVNVRTLEDRRGNIKALAREALERKLPEIKNIFEYEGQYENPLAEIFPNQPKTVSPKFVDPKELREQRAQREAQRDMQRRVQSGDIDLDNPTSKGEKLLARTNKQILDALNEEKAKQQEVAETLRDAMRFKDSIDTAYRMLKKKSTLTQTFSIQDYEYDIEMEEEKENPDKNFLSLLKDMVKTRKNFNKKSREYVKEMRQTAFAVQGVTRKLKRVKPKLKTVSEKKKNYSKAINELIDAIMLGRFTELGKKYNTMREGAKPELNSKEEAEQKNKLTILLERDSKFKPLLTDEEMKQIIKETDSLINQSFKLEEFTDNLETLEESLEEMLKKEKELNTKISQFYGGDEE